MQCIYIHTCIYIYVCIYDFYCLASVGFFSTEIVILLIFLLHRFLFFVNGVGYKEMKIS
jgi:hypothetical protein